jgi:uncharacterized protein (TIGR00251 family)
MPWITPYPRGVRIQVKVQPRASKNEIAGVMGEFLRIRLTAPPVEGEANKKLIKFLSKVFGCGARSVKILSGTTGRCKLVEIDGVSEDEARSLVADRCR